ncbi:MAG: iron complex transport system substrate-binding protein [Rhodothermales bacterium]|jgi:iron complex transport system substrate-binding protein
MAFAAGLGERLVAVTDADDFPPQIEGLTRIAALPLNHEAVVALRPDLILASDQVNSKRDADALAELGIPTFFVSVQSLPDVSRGIRSLGALFGGLTAPAYADSLERLLASLDETRSLAPDTFSVIFLIGDETLFSFGPESYVHDMILVAGGRSLTETMDTDAPILSEEFVLQAGPDVLFTAFEVDIERLVTLHPSWSLIPAVSSGRVFQIPPDLVLRAGPRLIAGTQAMSDAMKLARAR